jgi:hypothetical protein
LYLLYNLTFHLQCEVMVLQVPVHPKDDDDKNYDHYDYRDYCCVSTLVIVVDIGTLAPEREILEHIMLERAYAHNTVPWKALTRMLTLQSITETTHLLLAAVSIMHLSLWQVVIPLQNQFLLYREALRLHKITVKFVGVGSRGFPHKNVLLVLCDALVSHTLH